VTRPRRAHASAPARIDFAGGWTDVPPFSGREGGAVVAAAITLRVHVNVLPGGDSVHLISQDLGVEVVMRPDGSIEADARLPLVEAAMRSLPAGNCTVTVRSDAPNGSGLGTSGALGVALVGALRHARSEPSDPMAGAAKAWHLEAVDAGHPGGKQDQYIAALGGFQLLEFHDPGVTAEPIALDAAFADELAGDLVLCYSGVSRVSGRMIARVVEGYERGDARITDAFRGMRNTAHAMREALVAGDMARVGTLLDDNWRYQQSLDRGMSTTEIGRIEAAARAAGAIGVKATGAGAGGSLVLLAPGRAAAVTEAARAAGATILTYAWDWDGVKTW